MPPETLTVVGAQLGESPLWHRAESAFYWVDIVGETVFRYEPGSGVHRVVFSGETVTAICELDGGGLLMVTPTSLSTLRDGALETLSTHSLPEGVRTNDAKCDPWGRLWFGTMDIGTTRPVGELFVFDGERSLVVDGLILSNGLGWSPSADVFYHVDSMARRLYSYDYDGETGKIHRRRVLADMNDRPEVPDGLAVDVDGNIWVAMYDGWCVNVFDPGGRIIHIEKVGVQKPTSVAFGGDDLSRLYITTASQELDRGELDRQPDAGELLRIDPGTTGLEVGVYGRVTASS